MTGIERGYSIKPFGNCNLVLYLNYFCLVCSGLQSFQLINQASIFQTFSTDTLKSYCSSMQRKFCFVAAHHVDTYQHRKMMTMLSETNPREPAYSVEQKRNVLSRTQINAVLTLFSLKAKAHLKLSGSQAKVMLCVVITAMCFCLQQL